jgi:Right handed beta helix region
MVLVPSFLLVLSGGHGMAGAFQSTSSGATYHIDSSEGDDSASGSEREPWKSLGKVNGTRFHGGDRILFKSGAVWTGQLWPKGSGTAERPIVIDKYGGDTLPVINGAGVAEDAMLLKNQEFWEVRHLEITNLGTSAGSRRGVNLVAEDSGDLHHIYLEDLYVHDVNGSDDDKANGGINYHVIGDVKPSRFIDLRIENNRIRRVDRNGIFGSSTHWMRSKWYPSLGVMMRGNLLEDIGGDGIVTVATDGAVIEHNVVAHANQRSAGYNDGIWPWSADNTVVQFNEVYGMRGQRDGMGFDSDWNSRNTIIQYNYSHDNEGGFLLICNEGSQDPSLSAGNTGTIVRYNISQNDHHRGINFSGPVKNTLIYNNTIYVGKNEDVGLVIYSDWTGWSSDSFFYNNIFYVEGSASFSYAASHADNGVYGLAPGEGKSTNNFFDYNTYYGVKPMKDAHASTANPMLIDPGHAEIGRDTLKGYALRKNSPAINSGKTIANNGGRDFVGTAVPQCGSADRGAIESRDCAAR